MESVAVRLQKLLDEVAKRSEDAAKRIMEAKVSAEAKCESCAELLGLSEVVPAYRRSALVTEVMRECDAFRPRVVKHNGRADNSPVVESRKTITETTKQLIKGFQALGLSEAEAKVAAQADLTEADHFVQLMKEGAE